MTTTPSPILFLSGAGLAPWVWDDVRADLDVASAVAGRPATGAASLVDHAEAAIAAAPEGRFTVVAHSVGGVVGAEVARLVPERVAGFLAVSAAIPGAGGSFVSAMPRPNRWILAAALRLGGPRPPDKAIRRGLGEGLDHGVVERIVAEFTTESPRLYLDPTSHTAWSGPRGYVGTTRDRELPLSLQRRFATRLGADWRHELDTGHLPMLEDPPALADAIRTFLSDRTCDPSRENAGA